MTLIKPGDIDVPDTHLYFDWCIVQAANLEGCDRVLALATYLNNECCSLQQAKDLRAKTHEKKWLPGPQGEI
ncbi:MAG: hypothetical protein MHMPM18_001331 [Marteilia pararefringens]